MNGREDDVSLDKLRELVEFGKFGFKGTLWSGISGMLLILGLALLDAFTELDLGAKGLIGMGALVFAGVICFGYFSLRKLPAIDIQITKDGEIKLKAKRS
jgi:hypothetical protein